MIAMGIAIAGLMLAVGSVGYGIRKALQGK
jgi:hypothetical protein